MENHTPTIIDHAQQMGVFTPTNLDGSFDINALTLGQTHYEGSNQVSRSNSVKKSKRSTGSSSNRASMGMINTSGYDSTNYGYASGHVTPDSITTSGAATPFTFPHESRSNQISPIGTMHQGNNGMDLAFGGVSRAPTSSNYSTGSLPHIAGQNRTHDIDWSTLSHYNPTDEYGNAQYHSGTNTPLHRVKSEHDFSTLPLGDYPYLHSKA